MYRGRGRGFNQRQRGYVRGSGNNYNVRARGRGSRPRGLHAQNKNRGFPKLSQYSHALLVKSEDNVKSRSPQQHSRSRSRSPRCSQSTGRGRSKLGSRSTSRTRSIDKRRSRSVDRSRSRSIGRARSRSRSVDRSKPIKGERPLDTERITEGSLSGKVSPLRSRGKGEGYKDEWDSKIKSSSSIKESCVMVRVTIS